MLRSFLLVFCLTTCLFSSDAQGDWRIHGIITDGNTDNPLSFATVYAAADTSTDQQQKILAFTTTDNQGKFSLTIKEAPSEVVLICNYLGYEKKIVPVLGETAMPLSIHMQPQEKDLQEVIVTEQKLPIQAKEDTVVYNASQFIDSTEVTVEDLLRKLPGVEVDEGTGQISVGGKPIKKLMIEGTDMFGRQYTIGSQNLPADYVEAVEVIDHYQENSVLAKITQSEDVVLNLKLKEEVKNIWAGNLDLGAGYGQELKVDTDINLFTISEKQKLLWIGNNGNTGAQYGLEELKFTYDFEAEDPLTDPLQEAPTFVNELQIDNLGFRKLFVDNSISTFNTLRGFYDFGQTVKVKANATYATQSDAQRSVESTRFLYETESYENSVEQDVDFANRLAQLDVELNYLHPENTRSFDFYALLHQDNSEGSEENRNLNAPTIASTTQLERSNLLLSSLFTQRLGEQNALLLAAKYNYVATPEALSSNNNDLIQVLGFDTATTQRFQQQLRLGDQLLNAEATYHHRFQSLFLEVASSLQYSGTSFSNELAGSTQDVSEITTTTSTNIRRQTNWLARQSVTLNKTFPKGLSAKINGTAFHQEVNRERGLVRFSLSESYSVLLQLNKQFSRKSKCFMSYQWQNEPLHNQDFLDVTYAQDNFTVYSNFARNQLPGGQQLRLRYTHENFIKLSSYYVGIDARWNQQRWISDFSFFNTAFLATPFFNQRANRRLRIYGKWKKFIGLTRTSLEFHPSYTISENEVATEGSSVRVRSQTINTRYVIGVRLHPRVLLNMRGRLARSYFSNRNAEAAGTLTDVSFSPFLSYQIQHWRFKANFYYFNSFNEEQRSQMMGSKLGVDKTWQIKGKRVHVEFDINNVLNATDYAAITNGDFFLFEQQIEAIAPFFVLSLSYSL